MKLKLNTSKRFKLDDSPTQVILGNKVIVKITDNAATFPHMKNTIAEITTANTELNSSHGDWKTKGDDYKGAFEGKHTIWLNMYGNLASYVDLVADGDEAIINKNGFPTTASDSVPAALLGQVQAITYEGKTSVSGKIGVTANKLMGAKGILFLMNNKNAVVQKLGDQINISYEGTLICSMNLSTIANVTFEGMPSLTSMLGYAVGMNSAGVGEISNSSPVSIP